MSPFTWSLLHRYLPSDSPPHRICDSLICMIITEFCAVCVPYSPRARSITHGLQHDQHSPPGCRTFHASTAAFLFLRQAAEESGDACILNITAEFFSPPFFAAHAAAAKMAIDSLTRSHSLEWSDYGIRVNGIAPGPIADTPGYDKLAGMCIWCFGLCSFCHYHLIAKNGCRGLLLSEGSA